MPHSASAEAGNLPKRRAGQTAYRAWNTVELPPKSGHQEVAIIAGEQLVAAVAGQRDRHLLARKAADEKGRDLGGVGERLVVDFRQERNDVASFVDRHIMFVVNRAEVLRDRLGMDGLVKAGFLEPDRKGADRASSNISGRARRRSNCRFRRTGRRRPARRRPTGRGSPAPAIRPAPAAPHFRRERLGPGPRDHVAIGPIASTIGPARTLRRAAAVASGLSASSTGTVRMQPGSSLKMPL